MSTTQTLDNVLGEDFSGGVSDQVEYKHCVMWGCQNMVRTNSDSHPNSHPEDYTARGYCSKECEDMVLEDF